VLYVDTRDIPDGTGCCPDGIFGCFFPASGGAADQFNDLCNGWLIFFMGIFHFCLLQKPLLRDKVR
jgi:hypothetical protein